MSSKIAKSKTGNGEFLRSDYFIRSVSGKYVFNSVIAMVFIFAGSLIDTVLVGLFVGETGLSAMSLISPVYLIYYTVGATVGIGASILASRVLGIGEIKEYRKIFSCASATLFVLAAVMTAVSYIFLDGIVNLLCGDVGGEIRENVKNYLLYYMPGGAFTLLSYIPLYFLKTDGKPKLSSRLFTLSAIMNVILSWLFMSELFEMEVGGASLATSISMGAVSILGFILMLKGETELKLERKSFSFKTLGKIAIAGIPNGVTNLLNSARILFINMLLINIRCAALLPCYTVVRNVSDILNSVILGISSAIIPLVGVFFGERDYGGNRRLIKYSMKLGIFIMIPLVLIFCFIPEPLFYLFGVTDSAVISEGRWAIPLACLGLIAAYANTLYVGYLTAIKREALATTVVALRLFVVLAIFALPLARFFSARGIWLSISISEIVTLIVYFIIVRVIMSKNKHIDKYLLDTEKEGEGDVSFSVKNDINDIVSATEKISGFCEDSGIDMKLSMKVSLAIEEILTFLNAHCLSKEEDSYTDVRVCKVDKEVMVRFRYVGKIYDPMAYYQNNEFNEELEDELLGLKLIMKSASLVNFRQTLGANNLTVFFGDKAAAKAAAPKE